MSDAARSGEPPTGNSGPLFRRWLRNPLMMGSIIPSAPALRRRIAAAAERSLDEYVLDLGAGTGVVTRALLHSGIALLLRP